MPTATYIALANYTVPSGGVASITFSSIPATYRDLVLQGNVGTVNNAVNLFARANSDSGANYSEVFAWGNGSTTSSGFTTGLTGFPIGFSYNTLRDMTANFMDYSATDKHKTALVRHGHNIYVMMAASRWANTNAITSLTIIASSGNLLEGSTFSLYGIIS